MQIKDQSAPVLLFNDECGVCRSIASWVKRQVQAGSGTTSIVVRPIGQDPEELRALN
jgi:predicted DCC family thiol-disulfide oxidoreductase YuxK